MHEQFRELIRVGKLVLALPRPPIEKIVGCLLRDIARQIERAGEGLLFGEASGRTGQDEGFEALGPRMDPQDASRLGVGNDLHDLAS